MTSFGATTSENSVELSDSSVDWWWLSRFRDSSSADWHCFELVDLLEAIGPRDSGRQGILGRLTPATRGTLPVRSVLIMLRRRGVPAL